MTAHFPSIQAFPDELLVQVLGYLPVSDLKSARLTSTRYGRIGAQWLFQRVYFAPRKSVIKTFLKISANVIFARSVTELVYDGRLFLPELVAYKPYKIAYDAYNNVQPCVGYRDPADADQVGNGTRSTNNADSDTTPPSSLSATYRPISSEVYHESLATNFGRYIRMFEQQQSILEDQKDYKALLTGLSNLPNITNVTIRDKFFDGSDLSYDYRLWPETGVVPLAPWPRNMHPGDAIGTKWDVRGVHHLIRALSVHCQKLTELDTASGSAPMTFFEMDDDVFEAACKMAQRLTVLKMGLYTSISDSGDDVQEQYKGLDGFMSNAMKLRCLDIRGRIDFDDIKHIVWPHLETLSLGDLGLDAADLKSMMQAHKGTLRDLEFCNVYLSGGEGWVVAAKEMSKYLKLRRICVLGVCDELTREAGETPYLEDEDNLAVARSFLSSVPSGKVQQVGEFEFVAYVRGFGDEEDEEGEGDEEEGEDENDEEGDEEERAEEERAEEEGNEGEI